MNRFAVGEIAIVAPCPQRGTGPLECEIMAVPSGLPEHIFGFDKRPDTYLVQIPGFHSGKGPGYFQVYEKHLRKRPQRGIPDEVRAWFDVPRKVGAPA